MVHTVKVKDVIYSSDVRCIVKTNQYGLFQVHRSFPHKIWYIIECFLVQGGGVGSACCGPRPQTIVWSNTINNSLKNFLLKTKHIYNNSLEYIIHLIQSVCIASTLFVKVKSKCCVIYHTSCMDRRPQCIVSMPKRHHRAASRLANATTEVRTLTQQHTILIDCVLILHQIL